MLQGAREGMETALKMTGREVAVSPSLPGIYVILNNVKDPDRRIARAGDRD
jgi:hypothetical protein